MLTIVSILIFIVAILLILIILVQNSKGGGLASNFTGGGNMGVRKTADFLEKATWTLASVLLVLSIAASAAISSSGVGQKSVEDEAFDELDPNQVNINNIQDEPAKEDATELQF